jgi:L-lactate utilization protein LutB
MTAKEKIKELHEKYYGPGSKHAKKKVQQAMDTSARLISKKVKEHPEIAPKADSSPSPKEGVVMHAGASRAQLMDACKQKGVKNYRVINKAEMVDILAHIGDQAYVDRVVAGAVARWKAGWGSGKKQGVA